MATTSTVLTRSPTPASGKYDRLFYGGMAVAMGLTVFAGFARTYYLRFFTGGPSATINGNPFTALVHVHGALFTAWVLLFIIQTAFIASRRMTAHRRLGVAGAMLAAAMVTAGTSLAIATTARGASLPGADALAFLAIPIFDMVLFAGFVAIALANRRNKEMHKRLMLLAYVSIIVAAMSRIPIAPAPGPFTTLGMSLFFVAVGAIYDLLSRRRVHQVYLWGGLIIAVSVPLRLVIGGTGPWRALAALMTK
jgi:hypothetical protein